VVRSLADVDLTLELQLRKVDRRASERGTGLDAAPHSAAGL
jgi:hypothetical protein